MYKKKPKRFGFWEKISIWIELFFPQFIFKLAHKHNVKVAHSNLEPDGEYINNKYATYTWYEIYIKTFCISYQNQITLKQTPNLIYSMDCDLPRWYP